jgi:C-terminal processing protease CtpA/Prc
MIWQTRERKGKKERKKKRERKKEREKRVIGSRHAASASSIALS